jgi:hypothetical protein
MLGLAMDTFSALVGLPLTPHLCHRLFSSRTSGSKCDHIQVYFSGNGGLTYDMTL